MRKALVAPLIVAMLLIVAAGLYAASDGRIAGEVLDAAGNPLEDVRVTVKALEVTYEKTAETNKKGKFVMVLLDAARDYIVRLEKEGYQTIEEAIDPIVGGTLRREWRMVEGTTDRAGEELLAAAQEHGKAQKVWSEARDAYLAGDLETARQGFEEALEIAPEMGAAHAGLARVALDQERYDVGLRHAKKLLEVLPDEVMGYRMAYDAHLKLGQSAEAAELLETLIEIDRTPGTAARVFNAAAAHIKAREYEAAMKRLEEAIEIDPELPEAYIPLGQLYLSEEQADKALAAATRSLELQPGNGPGLVLSYRANLELGNAEVAEQTLADLRTADPATFVKTFMTAGTEDFNHGDPAGAIVAFEKVLTASPEHARAHYMLGLAHAGSDAARAKEYLARFLELAPDDPDAETAKAMIAGL